MNFVSKKAEKVVLITNTAKDSDFSLYKKILELILSHGAEARTPEIYKDECFDPRIRYMPEEALYEGADAAIVLGGDGTILKWAPGAVHAGCPILGVNLGRVGYMAEIGKDEIELISRLFEGRYLISERMTLSVSVIEGGDVRTVYENALNDAVIHSNEIGRVLDLELFSGGVRVAEHRGDGIIISTPTGSTAYSMAAGGPVLDPNLECICITPVCALSPAARPMVFSAERELEIKKGHGHSKGFYLSCDGADGETLSGEAKIIIKRSDTKAKLISIDDEEFFSVFRKKITSAM